MRTSWMLAAMTAVCAAAAPAGAEIIVFDDANQNGWSRPWYTGTQTTNVRSGSTATQTANGQTAFEHTGAAVGEDYILEMWVNTSSVTPGTRLFIDLSYTEPGGVEQNNRPFDARNVPVTYNWDGSDLTFSPTAIQTDGDTSTWQRLRLDLTQKTYTGFPYVEHQFNPATHLLKRINLRSEGGQAGNVIVDDVRLIAVPEPAALAIAAAGVPLALVRRRRA